MITIELKDLQFFSFHGLHEAERILGNNFAVNVSVTITAQNSISNLDQSVDYVLLYEIVKKRMEIPTALLETLVQEMSAQIHSTFVNATAINISIDKIFPPISGFQGTVGVSFTEEF